MRLKDWPAAERPREKLLARGVDALSDAELLATILRTGARGGAAPCRRPAPVAGIGQAAICRATGHPLTALFRPASNSGAAMCTAPWSAKARCSIRPPRGIPGIENEGLPA